MILSAGVLTLRVGLALLTTLAALPSVAAQAAAKQAASFPVVDVVGILDHLPCVSAGTTYW